MTSNRKTIAGFVAFEGLDGSGTTTQLGRLGAWLDGLGVSHHETFEPTSSPIGALIRRALSGAEAVHPETVARLFAADRGEHVFGRGGIAERAGSGTLVVSDRYLFSSLAYQGLTCGPELPAKLNEDFPLPELLILFEIDPRLAASRLASRKSLDIYENTEFQLRVAAAYERVVAEFSAAGLAVARVDASRPEDEVESAVRAAIRPIVERLSASVRKRARPLHAAQ